MDFSKKFAQRALLARHLHHRSSRVSVVSVLRPFPKRTHSKGGSSKHRRRGMNSAMSRRNHRKLRVELLEDRIPLAADLVTAAMSASGDLIIKGDVHENHIAIFDDGAGHVV